MIMKKSMILAAVAALALAACTKVETYQNTTDENVISFGVYTGRSADTKATYGEITSVSDLQSSADGFGVFAYYTKENNWASTDKPDFMYNQQVVYNASADAAKYPSKWQYSPLKYWPNGQNSTEYTAAATSADKLSFFAYAPYSAVSGTPTEGITALSANNAAGAPTVTFTVPAAHNQQIDLLYATPIKDQTKQALSGRVAFAFHHALMQINFKVQAVVDAAAPTTSALGSETKIILTDLKIESTLATTGKLNLNDGTWSNTSGTSTIDYNASDFTTTTVTVGSTDYVGFNVTETATAVGGNSNMVIPGTVAAGDYKVVATYYVITTDSKLENGASVVQNVISKVSTASTTFDAGKKYTILVKLGLNSVDFNVTSVDTWTAADGTPIDLPLNS